MLMSAFFSESLAYSGPDAGSDLAANAPGLATLLGRSEANLPFVHAKTAIEVAAPIARSSFEQNVLERTRVAAQVATAPAVAHVVMPIAGAIVGVAQVSLSDASALCVRETIAVCEIDPAAQGRTSSFVALER